MSKNMAVARLSAIKPVTLKNYFEIMMGHADAVYIDLRQLKMGRKPQSWQTLGTNSKAPKEDGCWLTFPCWSECESTTHPAICGTCPLQDGVLRIKSAQYRSLLQNKTTPRILPSAGYLWLCIGDCSLLWSLIISALWSLRTSDLALTLCTEKENTHNINVFLLFIAKYMTTLYVFYDSEI